MAAGDNGSKMWLLAAAAASEPWLALPTNLLRSLILNSAVIYQPCMHSYMHAHTHGRTHARHHLIPYHAT